MHPAGVETPVEIAGLLVSSLHAFEGRPADGPRPDPDGRHLTCVEVCARGSASSATATSDGLRTGTPR